MLIHLQKTRRFCVLEHPNQQCHRHDDKESRSAQCGLPVVSLYDIFEAHGSLLRRSSTSSIGNRRERDRGTSKTTMSHQLHDSLVRYGFVLIRVPKGRAATAIHDLRTSLQDDFFPTTASTHQGRLQTSSTIYVSERGIPMYKLGYELCDDHVREVFRIATGPTLLDSAITWPTINESLSRRRYHSDTNRDTSSPPLSTQAIWTRGIGLLRHVTDAMLDLLLLLQQQQQPPPPRTLSNNVDTTPPPPQQRRILHRPHSGAATWWDHIDSQRYTTTGTTTMDRRGDYSMLYAMHYFNDGITMVEPGVSVKEHVDPSLMVVEPFLCTTTTGLQVWDRPNNGSWMDCDGPNSPMHSLVVESQRNGEELMLVFVGKALSEAIPSIPPTLHRVVTGHRPRRTIIYEQKYAEFYPTPTFD